MQCLPLVPSWILPSKRDECLNVCKKYIYQYYALKYGCSGCYNGIVCFRSLLTFVAMDTGTLSYELLLRYLTLCVTGGHDAEVSEVYDIMRGSFPSLDTGASSLFIKSFSRTERWREALNILNELKMVNTYLFWPHSENRSRRNVRVPWSA